MEYYMRLPRNRKEFVLFMLVISIISVNIIAPTITCMELGFSAESWLATYSRLPFVWLTVVACVLVTYAPAGWLTDRLVEKDDSYKVHILANILASVFFMSVVLTVVAPWVVAGQVTTEPLEMFVYRWPRNFAVSFAVEALVAQPIARAVMNRFHLALDARQPQVANAGAEREG